MFKLFELFGLFAELFVAICKLLWGIIWLAWYPPYGWIFWVVFFGWKILKWYLQTGGGTINGIPKNQCGKGWKYHYREDGTLKTPTERENEHYEEFKEVIDRVDRENGWGKYAKDKDN